MPLMPYYAADDDDAAMPGFSCRHLYYDAPTSPICSPCHDIYAMIICFDAFSTFIIIYQAAATPFRQDAAAAMPSLLLYTPRMSCRHATIALLPCRSLPAADAA